MDFVEQFFGISPDGGNGTFEFALLLTFAAAPLAFVLGRKLIDPLLKSRGSAESTRT